MKAGFFPPCGRLSRRNLLVNCGMGFAGVAINAILGQDLLAAEESPGSAAPSDRLRDGRGKGVCASISPPSQGIIIRSW